MLTNQQLQQFQRDGYLKGERVLDDAQIETLREETERVIAQRDDKNVQQPVMCHNMTGQADAPVWQIVNIWEASAPFRQVVSQPQIAQEMAQLTQAQELRLWHDQIQYKPASKGGVNMWHQDAPLWPILAPMTEVSAWVALDDVDEANGCMWMVPGSHLWGNHIAFLQSLKTFDEMPSEYNGHAVAVRSCPVKKGEVHYHHALTWHGSPANTSGRPRRAVALHYMTGETRFVQSGNHPMKPFVEVADGDFMRGGHFPLVWEGGRAVK